MGKKKKSQDPGGPAPGPSEAGHGGGGQGGRGGGQGGPRGGHDGGGGRGGGQARGGGPGGYAGQPQGEPFPSLGAQGGHGGGGRGGGQGGQRGGQARGGGQGGPPPGYTGQPQGEPFPSLGAQGGHGGGGRGGGQGGQRGSYDGGGRGGGQGGQRGGYDGGGRGGGQGGQRGGHDGGGGRGGGRGGQRGGQARGGGQGGPPPGYTGQPQGEPFPLLGAQGGPPPGYTGQPRGQPGPPAGIPAQTPVESRPPSQQERRDSQASVESARSSQKGPPSEHGSAASQKSVELIPIPTRKLLGSARKKPGRPIQVDVNHMELMLSNYNIVVFHYDIVFDPDKPKYMLRPAIQALFEKNFPGRTPIFDGQKNLFAAGQLDEKKCRGEVEVFNPETQRNKAIRIEMSAVGRIEMKDLLNYQGPGGANVQRQLLVLDVALRSLCSSRFIQNGRRFFTPPNTSYKLGNGLELWHGHYQSAVMGWKPYLCVDISNTAFYTANSIEETIKDVVYYGDGYADRELDRQGLEALNQFIKGVKVDYVLPNNPASRRTFRVHGVEGPASKETFEDDNKKKWTIADYFRQVKACPLKKPFLPCLRVGNLERRIRIPSEFCQISPNQPCNRKLDERQTAEMVKRATSDTIRRRNNIMDAYKKSGMTQPNPYMKEFGISVSGKFERVEARILDPPPLQYAPKQPVRPAKGQWRVMPFANASALSKWAIVNLERRVREDSLHYLEKEMITNGRNVGMQIAPAFYIEPLLNKSGPTYDKALIDFFSKMKSSGAQLVVVIVPDRGDFYAKVKTTAEIHVGMLTQCIKSNTVNRMKPATVSNILLKVNAKLDGMNHCFADNPLVLARPVMIVGADVTHPAPGQTNTPSIAAVAASHDKRAFKYNMIWRMQPKGEMIVDLQNIMKEQLMYFYKTTNYKPEKIIFFRDGVSDGEIQKVMSTEINAIRLACKSFGDGSYEPKITFLVVQKRHHTRFFPVNDRDPLIYDQKNFNLPAGTVVDTEIVHPHETEFLLLSHASILGTARPTKYRLVYDDTNFSEDELEQMAYYLCHMFSRCTRSVSYPAPTYYAHLAAFRARHYIDSRLNLKDLAIEQKRKTLNPELLQKNPMFFV